MFWTKRQVEKMKVDSINVGSVKINAKLCVGNLGALFDSELKMRQHVLQILRSGYFHLRQIRVIRKYLTVSAAKALVGALVCSRMDYWNGPLFWISDDLLSKLHVLQNDAAKVVTKQCRCESVSKTLFYLHWLPVKARIMCKINLWVFKALKGEAPGYIRELLVIKLSSRCTRLSEQLCLEVPRTIHKTTGDRSFSIAGLFFLIRFL